MKILDWMQVYQGSVPVHTSSIYNLHDSARHFTVPMGERGLALRGDILVKCYHRHRQPIDGRETVFSLQFHTCAVTQHTLVFQRQDLDDACQGKNWDAFGACELVIATVRLDCPTSLMTNTHARVLTLKCKDSEQWTVFGEAQKYIFEYVLALPLNLFNV